MAVTIGARSMERAPAVPTIDSPAAQMRPGCFFLRDARMDDTGRRRARRIRAAGIALAWMACSALAPAAGVATPASAAHQRVAPKQAPKAAPAQRLVDINSASRQQLKTLPGIGDAEAERIVAGRPYLSKADLVATKALPAGSYQSIRHSIIALPPATKGARRAP